MLMHGGLLKSRFLSVCMSLYQNSLEKKIISLELSGLLVHVNKYNMLAIVKLTGRWAHNNVKLHFLSLNMNLFSQFPSIYFR